MKLLLTGLAISLAGAVPTAGADDTTPHRYAGKCSFATVNDTTPTAVLGGSETWNGQADVLVRSTDATGTPTVEPIAVTCELFVGGVSHGVVLSASGQGVAAGAATLQFRARVDDAVTICTHVTVGTRHTHCADTWDTELIPPPVVELVGLVIDTLNREVFSRDWGVCASSQSLAGSYGPVYVNQEGDVFLFGTTGDHLWWDCPPYYVPPGG